MSEPNTQPVERVSNELDVLASLVVLDRARIVELGCGAAGMARELVTRFPDARYVGYEVDRIQHEKNLEQPAEGMRFMFGGAQHITEPDASFDLALMLKSLHHVPAEQMSAALDEVARVVKPGGFLYVSEPLYEGSLNELIRLFNDEKVVRARAQDAVDRAVAGPAAHWTEAARRRFDMPVRYQNFADFEARSMHATFRETRPTAAVVDEVRRAYEQRFGEGEARLERPLLVRLLARRTS